MGSRLRGSERWIMVEGQTSADAPEPPSRQRIDDWMDDGD
jgi:hypothetical protein